jgi:hypothetical protein
VKKIMKVWKEGRWSGKSGEKWKEEGETRRRRNKRRKRGK